MATLAMRAAKYIAEIQVAQDASSGAFKLLRFGKPIVLPGLKAPLCVPSNLYGHALIAEWAGLTPECSSGSVTQGIGTAKMKLEAPLVRNVSSLLY